MRLLFVCSGNICRSPMAAEYLRHRAAPMGLSHLVVDSAGTLGIEGHPASTAAIQVLAELGVDLSRHRSRGLSSTDLKTADIVVAMARSHLDEIDRRFAEGGARRYLLRAFEHGAEPAVTAVDLDDPIGRPIEVYRAQMDVIVPCVDHLALHLRHLQ